MYLRPTSCHGVESQTMDYNPVGVTVSCVGIAPSGISASHTSLHSGAPLPSLPCPSRARNFFICRRLSTPYLGCRAVRVYHTSNGKLPVPCVALRFPMYIFMDPVHPLVHHAYLQIASAEDFDHSSLNSDLIARSFSCRGLEDIFIIGQC